MIHISGILENRFSKALDSSFVAKVFGGTNDQFSKQQQQLILEIFKKKKINCDVLLLSQDTAQSSQSVLQENGEVTFLKKKRLIKDWNICRFVNMESGTIT